MQYPKSERLLFRKINKNDQKNISSLLKNNEVMRYCEGTLNDEEIEAWISSVLKYYSKYGYDYFALIEKTTSEFIGLGGIIKEKIDNELLDCIAFMIKKEKWSLGYGKETAKACIKFAFDSLNNERVYATVEKDNKISKRILESLGMIKEKEEMFAKKNVMLYVIERD